MNRKSFLTLFGLLPFLYRCSSAEDDMEETTTPLVLSEEETNYQNILESIDTENGYLIADKKGLHPFKP